MPDTDPTEMSDDPYDRHRYHNAVSSISSLHISSILFIALFDKSTTNGNKKPNDQRIQNCVTQDTFRIQSTAGAVPVKNQKGEISMQKVKVQRYIAGKKPTHQGHNQRDYSDDDEEEEDFTYSKREYRFVLLR